LCRLFQTCGLAVRFNRQPDVAGAQQRFADISVFGTAVERNQAIAVRAIGLEPVAYPMRALAKYLRTFRAFDSDFFVDHEMPLSLKGAVCVPRLNCGFEDWLKF
jgi:hypothetical protein